MKRHAPAESRGEKVPLWIISFADMITLLLSFFVMLQTMAHTQDAKLMGASRESFRRAIAGFGLPDLVLGKQPSQSLDYHKLKYPTEENDDTPGFNRVIDADDEQIRNTFEDLKKNMETRSSDTRAKVSNVIVTPITFAGAGAQLNEAARSYLGELAGNLTQETRRGGGQLFVLGMAGEADVGGAGAAVDESQLLSLSARRAQVVSECMRPLLSARGQRWGVTAWGIGKGDEHTRSLGAVAGRTFIVIAVAEVQKTNG